MFRIFKITSAGPKRDGQDLLGLLIVESSEGFYVIAPEPGLERPRILASTDLVNLSGKPPLAKFKFHHDKREWDLEVDSASAFEMKGTWTNPANPEKPAEPDTWVASGTGIGEPGDEEEKAASAKYGQ